MNSELIDADREVLGAVADDVHGSQFTLYSACAMVGMGDAEIQGDSPE